MKRSIAATVAFYVGILCLFLGIIDYVFTLQSVIKAKPSSLFQMAEVWFLITLICYVHDIYKKVVGNK